MPGMTIMFTGHVAALNRSVGSQYAEGLFTQHPGPRGGIYNASNH